MFSGGAALKLQTSNWWRSVLCFVALSNEVDGAYTVHCFHLDAAPTFIHSTSTSRVRLLHGACLGSALAFLSLSCSPAGGKMRSNHHHHAFSDRTPKSRGCSAAFSEIEIVGHADTFVCAYFFVFFFHDVTGLQQQVRVRQYGNGWRLQRG